MLTTARHLIRTGARADVGRKKVPAPTGAAAYAHSAALSQSCCLLHRHHPLHSCPSPRLSTAWSGALARPLGAKGKAPSRASAARRATQVPLRTARCRPSRATTENRRPTHRIPALRKRRRPLHVTSAPPPLPPRLPVSAPPPRHRARAPAKPPAGSPANGGETRVTGSQAGVRVSITHYSAAVAARIAAVGSPLPSAPRPCSRGIATCKTPFACGVPKQ